MTITNYIISFFALHRVQCLLKNAQEYCHLLWTTKSEGKESDKFSNLEQKLDSKKTTDFGSSAIEVVTFFSIHVPHIR